MNMHVATEKELIGLAKTSKNNQELYELHLSPSMNVRRAVARNINITEDIANRLAFDPVQNVCFMAVQNPKCTMKREFENITCGCVFCEKDERDIHCEGCENRLLKK